MTDARPIPPDAVPVDPMPERLPDRLSVSDDLQILDVAWSDGAVHRIPARMLRAQARDAATRREIHDTGTVRIAEGLGITGLSQVGSHAVGVTFSDGHDRAIYPFAYLWALGAASAPGATDAARDAARDVGPGAAPDVAPDVANDN